MLTNFIHRSTPWDFSLEIKQKEFSYKYSLNNTVWSHSGNFDNNVSKSIKLLYYTWEELWWCKVWIISKADCPLEKTSSKEHLATENTVQLPKLISFLDPVLPAFLGSLYWLLWSTITFTVKIKFFKTPGEICWCTSSPKSFTTPGLRPLHVSIPRNFPIYF